MTLSKTTRSAFIESAAQAQTFLDASQRFDDVHEKAIPAQQMAVRKVALTSAQILALNTAPQTLVPAPGAGRAIVVHEITARLTYGSAAYATNTTMEFRYTNGSGTKVAVDMASLLAATANKTQRVPTAAAEMTLTANAPVVVNAATGNPATGNSSVEFTVRYSEVEAL